MYFNCFLWVPELGGPTGSFIFRLPPVKTKAMTSQNTLVSSSQNGPRTEAENGPKTESKNVHVQPLGFFFWISQPWRSQVLWCKQEDKGGQFFEFNHSLQRCFEKTLARTHIKCTSWIYHDLSIYGVCKYMYIYVYLYKYMKIVHFMSGVIILFLSTQKGALHLVSWLSPRCREDQARSCHRDRAS